MKRFELGKVLFLILIIVLSTSMISASDLVNNSNETIYSNISIEKYIIKEINETNVTEELVDVVEVIQEEIIQEPKIEENIVILA
ncbi:hypothetical protein KY334_04545, partial [Candidatus Woesearchaeota archaeon]|nr:hypothetical protein [Candidatus Woesearchaeota archaeon]